MLAFYHDLNIALYCSCMCARTANVHAPAGVELQDGNSTQKMLPDHSKETLYCDKDSGIHVSALTSRSTVPVSTW